MHKDTHLLPASQHPHCDLLRLFRTRLHYPRSLKLPVPVLALYERVVVEDRAYMHKVCRERAYRGQRRQGDVVVEDKKRR